MHNIINIINNIIFFIYLKGILFFVIYLLLAIKIRLIAIKCHQILCTLDYLFSFFMFFVLILANHNSRNSESSYLIYIAYLKLIWSEEGDWSMRKN